VHNTTEGIAIASPIAGGDVEVPPSWPHLGALVLIAGAPTIVGAWAGAFLFTPAWAAFAFGLAAGAIAEVIWSIGRRLVASGVPGAVALGFLSGVAVMYTTSLLTS
jgi:zinc transporter ZupT